MRNIIVICVMMFFVASCKNSHYPQGIDHVIVIGIDGMSVEGLKKAVTPYMDELIKEGALCERVRTVQPSSSAPNWSSMLMGAGTEIHGITGNDWRIDDHKLKSVVVNEQGFFPTVLSVIRAQLPQAEIGMIYHWEGFGNLFEKELASIDKNCLTQEETALTMVEYIKEKKPLLLFSQLDDVDGAGHRYGHMTQGYLDAISRVDSLVGQILNAIKESGIENTTLIMVVSDHGGIDSGHGGTTHEEITVPFILKGKGIKTNYKIPTDIYMYDVAPTITYALGLAEPYAWRGKAIRCAFIGNEEPTDPLELKRD